MSVPHIIGVPANLGAPDNGVAEGPSVLRAIGLSEVIEKEGWVDAGDVDAENVMYSGVADSPDSIWRVADICAQVAEKGQESIESGGLPVYIGGDHSLSVGSLLAAQYPSEVGVLWFDSHPDFNTPETSLSGNFHGMPLATALGRGRHAHWGQALGVRESNTVIYGVRDTDAGEQTLLDGSSVTVYTMAEIMDRGVDSTLAEAVNIALDGLDSVHVSWDLDWVDPRDAPGVTTPVPEGIRRVDALRVCRRLSHMHSVAPFIRSVDIVELNPSYDTDRKTAMLALDCLLALLAK